MRGADSYTEAMFTVATLDNCVPANHPLRPIRNWLNDALKRMDPVFTRMYESGMKGGRSSIAPEKLIRALLLQVLYSIRSERMLMEQISYNMLFRGFVGLAMDDAVWITRPSARTANACGFMTSSSVCLTKRLRPRTRVATSRASISALTAH
ncbi:transposase [Pandoraea sputorum]|uniref:Transposase n=1 Tax=Pandoraea sputorum TaxID=93222 RepID=A0A5E5BHT9_9BURK|nr:transposase [Pandoraea sputorum]